MIVSVALGRIALIKEAPKPKMSRAEIEQGFEASIVTSVIMINVDNVDVD